MNILPIPLQNLIIEFSKLPGIGPKTASRLSFYLLKSKTSDVESFAKALSELKKTVTFCSCCFNLTEKNPCPICADLRRDKSLICVVEEPMDIVAINSSGEFSGLYHVLHGSISPINNVGPEDLKINELLNRLKQNPETKEIILATNPNLEGEATAMYIAKLVKPLGIKTTRIARGLPSGGDLEYADEVTLSNAMNGRKEY